MIGAFFTSPNFATFLVAGLILAITPGPGVVYLLTQTLGHGRKAGLASVGGIALGNLGNASAASVGLAAIFAASSSRSQAPPTSYFWESKPCERDQPARPLLLSVELRQDGCFATDWSWPFSTQKRHCSLPLSCHNSSIRALRRSGKACFWAACLSRLPYAPTPFTYSRPLLSPLPCVGDRRGAPMEDTSPPHRLSGSASMQRLQARDQQNRPTGLAGWLKELSVQKNPYLEVTPTTLDAAFAANPARFKGVAPRPPAVPLAAWINPPKKETTTPIVTPICSLNS